MDYPMILQNIYSCASISTIILILSIIEAQHSVEFQLLIYFIYTSPPNCVFNYSQLGTIQNSFKMTNVKQKYIYLK